MNKFERGMSDSLKAAGFNSASLVESDERGDFGDSLAIFSCGSLIFKFIRDRGQVFMDLASASAPEKFYQFDDVEIAMGWKNVDQVLEKKAPEDINHILTRLYTRLDEIDTVMSGERAQFMRKRIEFSAKERGNAFVNRLKGNN